MSLPLAIVTPRSSASLKVVRARLRRAGSGSIAPITSRCLERGERRTQRNASLGHQLEDFAIAVISMLDRRHPSHRRASHTLLRCCMRRHQNAGRAGRLDDSCKLLQRKRRTGRRAPHGSVSIYLDPVSAFADLIANGLDERVDPVGLVASLWDA
jgi:hypothetical protein